MIMSHMNVAHNPDTTQLFRSSNYIGPGYHAAVLFSGLRVHCSVVFPLFSQPIREDFVIAAYCPK